MSRQVDPVDLVIFLGLLVFCATCVVVAVLA